MLGRPDPDPDCRCETGEAAGECGLRGGCGTWPCRGRRDRHLSHRRVKGPCLHARRGEDGGLPRGRGGLGAGPPSRRVDAVVHLAGDLAALVPVLREGVVSLLIGSPDQLPAGTATLVPVVACPTPDVQAALADFSAGTPGKLVLN